MGRKRRNKPGEKYGKWTLIKPIENSRKWECKCECGTIKNVRVDTLINGQSTSCGCDTKRLQSISKTKQGAKEDLTGKRFGRLTVVEYVGNSKWKCICDCGNITTVQTGQLNFGTTKSCGCYTREVAREATFKHGQTGKKLYRVWASMKSRCHCETDKNYKRYGARGIEVFEKWRDDYVTFYNYVSKLEHFGERGYSIDRIDVNGNYEPGNVRWADRITQMGNTRVNVRFAAFGKELTAREWSIETGLPATLIYTRIHNYQWSIERALTEPLNKRYARNQKRCTNVRI